MGNKLKETRERIGIPQERLAEIANVSRATISALENNKADVVKTDTLVKLADALGGKVCDIFFS